MNWRAQRLQQKMHSHAGTRPGTKMSVLGPNEGLQQEKRKVVMGDETWIGALALHMQEQASLRVCINACGQRF